MCEQRMTSEIRISPPGILLEDPPEMVVKPPDEVTIEPEVQIEAQGPMGFTKMSIEIEHDDEEGE